jgi:prepilin-type N-terminal cleavage/methylation domain-containing protein
MKIKKHNLNKGFTIVEIMVVVAIGLILLTLSFVSASRARIKTRDKVRVADINTIRLAIEEYKLHCGEYPARIEEGIHNGCHNGEHLSDYLPYIPVAPTHGNTKLSSTYSGSVIEGSGYFYSGLSTSSKNRCYDYHIAAELEMSEEGHNSKSKYLSEDHDAGKNSGKYRYPCIGSKQDFSDDPGDNGKDDAYGLYDFRSDASF